MNTVRVALPYHLYTLARCGSEVTLDITGPVTLAAVLAALETAYPMLVGTVRVGVTRRPLIRFFACQEDWSNAAPDAPLPAAVVSGHEPLLVVGAIAGG